MDHRTLWKETHLGSASADVVPAGKYEKNAWKNSGFNGIKTSDLCITDAVLYQTELWSHICWEQVNFCGSIYAMWVVQ